MTELSLIKKITVKTVCGKITAPDKKTSLMHVYGTVSDMIKDSSDLGPFVKFKGSFEAVNQEDGTFYRAGSMILPGIAEDILAHEFSKDGVNAVEFAFDVGVKKSNSPVGYEFTIVPLIKIDDDNDPLLIMRKKLSNLLSAPKKKAS